MKFSMKGVAVKAALTLGAATIAPLAVTTAAHADTACSTGYFCVWTGTSFTGTKGSLFDSNSSWSGLAINNTDDSWKNRYSDWTWACTYEFNNYSGRPWVWAYRGENIRWIGDGNHTNANGFNHSTSNRGRYSNQVC
ncbi:hypothetical protein GCM10027589_24360 [Actinocorallia lasiicapitis]